jgi:hypothetical protein
MSVDVAVGYWEIAGSRYNTAGTTNVAISASEASPRYDVVVGNTSSGFTVVKGTAAAVPIEPDITYASQCIVAVVYVAAGVTQINNADITDARIKCCSVHTGTATITAAGTSVTVTDAFATATSRIIVTPTSDETTTHAHSLTIHGSAAVNQGDIYYGNDYASSFFYASNAGTVTSNATAYQTYWVSDKAAGSFKINSKAAVTSNKTFDYVIL